MAIKTLELTAREIGSDVSREICLGRFEFNADGTEIIGIVFESPDGGKWKLKIDNAGATITEAI